MATKKKTTKKKATRKKTARKKAAKKKTSQKKASKKKTGKSGAPLGNQFWKARSSHGRKPTFKSVEDLWQACTEYFQWVEDNPLQEEKVFCYKGRVTKTTVNRIRAMTISGLCLFLDICESTWKNYRDNEDFLQVITAVEKTIYDQKFSGAAADMLNANIIARDLGLKDKKDLSSDDGTMTPKSPTTITRVIVDSNDGG